MDGAFGGSQGTVVGEVGWGAVRGLRLKSCSGGTEPWSERQAAGLHTVYVAIHGGSLGGPSLGGQRRAGTGATTITSELHINAQNHVRISAVGGIWPQQLGSGEKAPWRWRPAGDYVHHSVLGETHDYRNYNL